MRHLNPTLLLFCLGPDSISQPSARLPLEQSWVPGPSSEPPEQSLLPEQEAQPPPRHMVKWLLITRREVVPNHYLSTVHFHKTQDCCTLLRSMFVGFCKCSFVVASSALGGIQGSALACGFPFPSVYFNELECFSVTEYQSPMALAVWELLAFVNGFCWAFWDQMLTIEIMHHPKQIKEQVGTSSLHRKWNQRRESSISVLLFVFKTNVYPWDF